MLATLKKGKSPQLASGLSAKKIPEASFDMECTLILVPNKFYLTEEVGLLKWFITNINTTLRYSTAITKAGISTQTASSLLTKSDMSS